MTQVYPEQIIKQGLAGAVSFRALSILFFFFLTEPADSC